MSKPAPSSKWSSHPTSLWHGYVTLLVTTAAGTSFGLLLCNILLLCMGVYKFPYPLTITLFQSCLTWLLVVGATSLTRTDSPLPLVRDFQLATASRETEPLPNHTHNGRNVDLHSMCAVGLGGSGGDDRLAFDWKIARQVLPLAAAYAGKVVLSNVSLAQAQLPMYLLTRISIVPWSLILTAVWTRTSHSAATLSSSLIATLSLLIATTGADFHFTPGSLVLGLTSSFCTALFPMLLLQTYRGLVSSIIAHRHGHSDYDPLSNDASNALKSKAELRAFWLTLRYTSLLASAILLPVVLLSNEPSDISRNCYVLDVKVFWTIFICSGIGSWCVLVCTLLLVQSTSPLTATFLSVPRSAFQLLVLSPTRMPLHSVIGVIMCWLSSVWFTISKRRERGNWPSNHAKSILLALRNAIIAVILYHGVYQLLYWGHTGLVDLKGTPSLSWKVPNTPATNAHANWINRPESAVTPKDDYLGVRPHVDTVANASMLVAKCRSFYKSTETDHDGVSCLSWLASAVDEYHVLPEAGRLLRASEQDPRKAEYANADGHENTLSHYASPDSVELSSMTSIGTCAGPIIPYHVYWTGPASWRVELFIKSYLYTQNLPCSRLWLWVDSDRNPDAPDEMLNEDPLFDRFKPLVRRGDVVVKVWKFPERIALPKEFPLANQAKPEEVAGPPDANGDVTIADAVVRDMKGRQWLVFPPRMALFPEVVSDLVRFVVLHLHGGVYCDMDILFLRDMRPLLLPEPSTGHHSFAEHWVERSHPADYNTAVMSLTAKSSLSTYLLHGGVRMGMNYHPKVIGRMAWKDERNQELLMLDTAAFDPSTPYMNHNLRHRCTTPCHRYYSDVFNGRTNDLPDEWRAYNGERLEEITFKRDELNEREEDGASSTIRGDGLQAPGTPVSLGYGVEKDRYRPSNRTLQNFFRGAWTYHIHNQWHTHPEPSSWLDVITHAQDGFLQGHRTNPYGEKWAGPALPRYQRWPEFE